MNSMSSRMQYFKLKPVVMPRVSGMILTSLNLSFMQNIKDNGALIQYTVNVTECLHITHCKVPFEWMNRNINSFIDQVVGLPNCEESIHHFDLYHILHCLDTPLEMIVTVEDKAMAGIDPTLSLISL